MTNKFFSDKLIAWYKERARPLPWRLTRDPYKIWISEIILQQTRVVQGLPYYIEFVRQFPTLADLANAPEQKILRLWQGLGYYSRARNLHRCAQLIVKQLNGKFPERFVELIKLPGIGPYSAAAIASLAFGEAVAVVDGNVFRVLARIFEIDIDITSGKGKKYFFLLANQLIDHQHPDLFNQALMEFGATHCLPQNPKCNDCIYARACQANRKNLQELLPVKSKKLKIKPRYFYYFIIRTKNKFLMKPRKKKDIWHGLYDFYLVESTRKRQPQMVMKEDVLLKKFEVHQTSKTFVQALTHQKLNVWFVELKPTAAKPIHPEMKMQGYEWFTRQQVNRLPKPMLVARYLKENPRT